MDDLFQVYDDSPRDHQLLLELMAFLDQTITRTVLTRAYNDLRHKLYLPRINVKQMVAQLVDLDLLEKVHRDLFRLSPSILEDVAACIGLRIAVPFVHQISTQYGSQEPLAKARRDWHARSLGITAREFSTPVGLEKLSMGITRPETFDVFPESIGLELVGRILARALSSDVDSSSFLDWLEPRLAQAPVLAREAYGYIRLLRGEPEFLPLLTRHHQEVLVIPIRNLLAGDVAAGVQKLRHLLDRSGKSVRFPFVTQELFYLAGCSALGMEKLLAERVKLCPSEVGQMVLAMHKARQSRRPFEFTPPPSDSHELQLAYLLCQHWSGRGDRIDRFVLRRLTHRFARCRFHTVVEILRALESARPHPLLELFESGQGWERLLGQLEGWSNERSSARAPSIERVVWMVDFTPDGHIYEVYPKTQRRSKKGGWTAGRRQYAYSITPTDDHDRRVHALWMDTRPFVFGFHSSKPQLGQILEALVDHPRVYDSRNSNRHLRFFKQAPRLVVHHESGGLLLQLELGRWTSEHIFCRELSPGHYGVTRLSPRLVELQELLGSEGFRLPAEGLERARLTLSRMVGEELELAGDLPMLLPGTTCLPGDNRLRVRLAPYDLGLSWTIRVAPDEEREESFEPGAGPKILTYQREGRLYELHRDLKAEKAALRKLRKAVPLLARGSESSEPRECLELLEVLKELPAEKYLLEWPEGEKFRLRPKLDPKALQIRVSGREDWFEVQGELRLSGEEKLTLAEVLTRLRDGGRFLQLEDGSYQALTEELRKRLAVLERAADRGHDGGLQLPWLAASLLDEHDAEGDTRWREQVSRLRTAATLPVDLPEGLTASLRAYQEEGFRWLARSAEWGVGVCLADDMGLGKTLQTLALLLRRSQDGPALVIAPTSVGSNWIEESGRFTPQLRPHLYSESERESLLEQVGPGDLVVCTYGLLVRDIESLKKRRWSTVVLDEAQAIKNSSTQRFKAAVALKAGFRLATTGTPVENHLDELWALFRFLNPALLGSKRRFSERFGSAASDPVATATLSALVRPFILRRLKSQVLKELPSRTEITLEVELSRKERLFYEGLRRDAVQRMEEAPELKLFTILVELTKLRRACCHPSLVKGGQGLESSKLHMFRSLLSEIVDGGHRVLVFSQFVDHLKLAVEVAVELGLSHCYLDGSTPTARRRKQVQEFQDGTGEVFFISLKAGGVGLNLTAANYVIHLDPW